MAKPSKAVEDFRKKYGVDADEIWEVHGSAWVVKHKALERVAAEQGIVFDLPVYIQKDAPDLALLVVGHLGERKEWSIGETNLKNCKNTYYHAMAEKRAKDRVILKLLAAHGELYASVDDFEQDKTAKRVNPHVTRASDVWDDLTTDLPWLDVPPMLRKQSKPEYAQLIKEMVRNQDLDELEEWRAAIHPTVSKFPPVDREFFSGAFNQYKKELKIGTSIHHKQAAE